VPDLFPEQLEVFVCSIFEKAGAPPENARLVAGHLVESNVQGHDSHGVLRIPQYCSAIENKELIPGARPELVHDSPGSVVLDGRSSFGQVAVTEAMSIAMNKAMRTGSGTVTLRNCYHSGRLGAYTAMAADAGMIGIMMVNAGGGGQSVVPFGGSARRLATNPISIAAPTSGDYPLVLDIATSMVPEGKIRDYAFRRAPLPEGWIVDAQGRPSNDAQDFYGDSAGAILPLGGPSGHKGFGLALMIDVLAGALSGAGCCREGDLPARDGVLLIALDIEQFSDRIGFYQHVSELIAYVKSCPPAAGYKEVFLPGEMEHRIAQQRRANGFQIDDDVWRQITKVAAQYEVTYKVDGATNGAPPAKHASLAAAKNKLAI
jgi:hydroxycarboxylate dehydrogenase B